MILNLHPIEVREQLIIYGKAYDIELKPHSFTILSLQDTRLSKAKP